MQQNIRSSRSFNWVTLILLIILIVIFYKELFIIGVRVYSAAVPSAEADRLLGDYYRNAGIQNEVYASAFYRKFLTSSEEKLQTLPPAQKARMFLEIGRIYECGRGTKVNLSAAKMHYQKAQQFAAQAPDKEAISSEADEAVKRASDESKAGQGGVCNEVFEYDVFQKLFGPSTGYSGGNNINVGAPAAGAAGAGAGNGAKGPQAGEVQTGVVQTKP